MLHSEENLCPPEGVTHGGLLPRSRCTAEAWTLATVAAGFPGVPESCTSPPQHRQAFRVGIYSVFSLLNTSQQQTGSILPVLVLGKIARQLSRGDSAFALLPRITTRAVLRSCTKNLTLHELPCITEQSMAKSCVSPTPQTARQHDSLLTVQRLLKALRPSAWSTPGHTSAALRAQW